MSEILIYKSPENQSQVEVTFEGETFWLSLNQISALFGRDKSVVSRHLKKIFTSGELDKNSVVAKNATTAADGKTYEVEYYNLDAIISVGYRVNSVRGTQFRQWATQRLRDFLVQGYAINEKRLAEKQQQVAYLKSGIRILSRAISQQAIKEDSNILAIFAKGLTLLDDFDHEELDSNGKTFRETIYPDTKEYLEIISQMQSSFSSEVFALPKDQSFYSSVSQIAQSFNGEDLYKSIEEKAATLLYLIVKNHSFVDGNKRIGAACFLYFLEKNDLLYTKNQSPVISNDALAAITLFVATSKTEEMDTVKKMVISILNRGTA